MKAITLITGIVWCLSLTAQEPVKKAVQEIWSLEKDGRGSHIESLYWRSQGGKKVEAASSELLNVVQSSRDNLKSNQTGGIRHAAILVPKQSTTIRTGIGRRRGGLAILLPGRTTTDLLKDEDGKPYPQPPSIALHPKGIYFINHNDDTHKKELLFYDVQLEKVRPLWDDIDPNLYVGARYANGVVRLTIRDPGREETVEIVYGPQGQVGKTTRFTTAIEDNDPADTLLKSLPVSATDLTLKAQRNKCPIADWMVEEAEKIEFNLSSDRPGQRSVLVVGKGDQSPLVNLVAKHIAEGKVPALEGWKIFEINAGQFSKEKHVGGDTEKVNNWFPLLSNKKLIIFINNIHNLTLIGGSRDSVDTTLTSAIEPWLRQDKIIIIGTTNSLDAGGGLGRLKDDDTFLSRFKRVEILEPSPKELMALMEKQAEKIEAKRAGVTFGEESLRALTVYVRRHFPNEAQPHIEIDIMEELAENRAMKMAKGAQSGVITVKDIREGVGERKGRYTLVGDKFGEFVKEENFMKAMRDTGIVGLDRPLKILNSALRQIWLEDQDIDFDFNGIERMQGVKRIFFTGPSGVGKTFLVDMLAVAMENYGIRWPTLPNAGGKSDKPGLQGTETSEPKSDWAVFGPPAGYILSDLDQYAYNDCKKNPEGTFLFDEAEKAHPNFWKRFMNVLAGGIFALGKNQVTTAWRGLIFLAGNLGAQGIAQDREASKAEREISRIIDEFDLWAMEELDENGKPVPTYTFRKYDITPIADHCWNHQPKWQKPGADQAAYNDLLSKLAACMKKVYGESGRLIHNQLWRRLDWFEIIPHWRRDKFIELIDVKMASRISKYVGKQTSDLVLTKELRKHLIDVSWGPGGINAFREGVSYFLDRDHWNVEVKEALALFAKKEENSGKAWVVDFIVDDPKTGRGHVEMKAYDTVPEEIKKREHRFEPKV